MVAEEAGLMALQPTTRVENKRLVGFVSQNLSLSWSLPFHPWRTYSHQARSPRASMIECRNRDQEDSSENSEGTENSREGGAVSIVPHAQLGAVHIREQRYGADAHFPAVSDNSHCNLAPVSN